MRAVLSVLLALLLLFPCVGLGEETAAQEPALLSIPLPMDFSGGCEPGEEYYLDEYTYEDPTISVKITYREDLEEYNGSYRGNKKGGVWIVDIRIGDASQLRTQAAKTFTHKKNGKRTAREMANDVKAVIAFNGDFATNRDEGIIIRQGTTYLNKLKKVLDVLAIDEDGDFHVFQKPGKGGIGETVDGKKIINAFYFGPILVNNGEVPDKFVAKPNYLHEEESYARLALCQVGPLHYKVLITTMQDVTIGMKLKDFARLCRDEGAIYAYNLDGGYSAAMVFRGTLVNDTEKADPRQITDIVYFASAWNGETVE